MEKGDTKIKEFRMLQNDPMGDSDRSAQNTANLSSTEYDPISTNTENYLADNENSNMLVDNQLLIGDRDVVSVISTENGRAATVG